jgi:hypothetical protein
MRKLIALLFCLIIAHSSFGLDVNLEKIDIEYTLSAEASVRTTMDITWTTVSSSMLGFYVQVQNTSTKFDQESSFVRVNATDKLDVSITQVGSLRYDVDIANGIRFKGKATYHLEPMGRIMLFVPSWDQVIGTQVITIVTTDILQNADALEATAAQYSVQSSWGANVVPTAIYMPEGSYLGFRVEEGSIAPRTSGSLLFARVQGKSNTTLRAIWRSKVCTAS